MKSSDMQNGESKETGVTEREEDFLSRWSRRKQESHLESSGTPEPPEGPPEPEPDRAVSEAPAKELTDEDMPPLEEMDQDSDFSPFLSEGVSAGLRQAALRKLFRSAKFNVCDGLDDYAEDYTKFAPLGNTITADMKHHMQRALDKLEAMADDAEPEVESSASGRTAEPAEQASDTAGDQRKAHEIPNASVSGPEEDDDPGHA